MADLTIFLMDLRGGGAERVMVNLSLGFVEQGLKVDFVLVQAQGPYLSQLSSKVNLIRLDKKRLLLSLFPLARYLKREKPPVLISALEDTNMIALWAAKLAGVSTQVVLTVHNNLSSESQNSTQLKRRLTPQLVKCFYPLADNIIAVSQGVADDLVGMGLNAKKIRAVYNPIVTADLQEKFQATIDHPWFKDQETPVILGVGRLDRQKDFSTLIQAFGRVREQFSARLMILGEGSERSHLEALVNELGLAEDVILPGFCTNPYAYMLQSKLLVMSSIWEGFGNVLVEAMAAGTPVVSTNCESGPAEILADGKYGELVSVGDVAGMAKAITNTLKKPLPAEILKQRAGEFSLEKAVEKYCQLWRKY